MQVEVTLQFFVGVYTEDLEYVDDWNKVVSKTLTSISGFWFDSFTSIPWSYLDLQLYAVLATYLALAHAYSNTDFEILSGTAGLRLEPNRKYTASRFR